MRWVGDILWRIRSSILPLRNYLLASHVLDPNPQQLSTLRTSNPIPPTPAPTRPTSGFFRIQQGLAAQQEGLDGNQIASNSATNHILHFTIQVMGLARSNYLTAALPIPSNPPAS